MNKYQYIQCLDTDHLGQPMDFEDDGAYWECGHNPKQTIDRWIDVAADRQLLQRCLKLLSLHKSPRS